MTNSKWIFTTLLLGTVLSIGVWGQDMDPDREQAILARRIANILRNAEGLLEEEQSDRAVRLLESILDQYPRHPGRFQARLMLGRHLLESGNAETAVRHYQAVLESEDREERAEALAWMGKARFQLGDYNSVFSPLRRIINEYADSGYVNEAYYYIGMTHFEMGRWSQAVEALQHVGTHVPAREESVMLSEAGQRLYLRIEDRDFIVLGPEQRKLEVRLRTGSGDEEPLTLVPLGDSSTVFAGSIETNPGAPIPGNGVIEFHGSDVVDVFYVDSQTSTGEQNVERHSQIRLVSTATVAFMDGAYREVTSGVFADQPFFVRVVDHDASVSKERDPVEVEVTVTYIEEETDDSRRGVDLTEEEERVRVRSTATIALRETEPFSGVFVGQGEVFSQTGTDAVEGGGSGQLVAMRGDSIQVEYRDRLHIGGDEPELRSHEARVLTGSIQDVRIEHREIDSEVLQARKELIESRLLLRLGEVFKEVGLQQRATERANQGLALVDNVIRLAGPAGLERSLVEQAYQVKWELMLVKNDLQGAVAVCRALIQRYPDSPLAEQAMMRIAVMRAESGEPAAIREAQVILQGMLRMPREETRAEAQYRLAGIAEQQAVRHFELNQGTMERPNMGQALQAYQVLVDRHPDSPYAAEALDKISNFYIQVNDYSRAIELARQVMMDYPDAPFVDNMLFKWALSAFRMNDFATAHEKAGQLLFDFPNSRFGEQAQRLRDAARARM